ncbi:MAG: hypothetical protein M1142_04575 [Patescibacteria group bacterium]|nr:hypothetical protein [Patescibacteria group bacterium]
MHQKGFSLFYIVFLITIILGSAGIYYLVTTKSKPSPILPIQQTALPPSSPQESPLPITSPNVSSTPTKVTLSTGANLEEIKYTLPPNWEAKIDNAMLFISPKQGGGFLSIKVYNYPSDTGKREYYCQITKYCITGTTYFTQVNIGNIAGYKASALDNSGGGSDYFAVKGGKLYIIGTYSPPDPNEFSKYFKEVLDSLIF